jgi:RES domain-containing protein
VITAWRIVKAEYADEVFSGEGGRGFKARWHSTGHRIVYTAGSKSLAALEWLVRTPRPRRLSDYVIATCTFPEVIVEDVDESRLPANWRDYPPPKELPKIGVEWLLSRSSAILSVPSAVVPEERNYLLNPEHEHFGSIDCSLASPFEIDLRLLT